MGERSDTPSNVIYLIENVCKFLRLNQQLNFTEKTNQLSPELSKLSEIWNISTEGSCLFSVIFELSMRKFEASIDDLCKHLSIDIFQFAKIHLNLEELQQAGLITYRTSGYRETTAYKIPTNIFNRILKNQPITKVSLNGLTNSKFLKYLINYFALLDDRKIKVEDLIYFVRTLINLNPELPLAKLINEKELRLESTFLLIGMVNELTTSGTSSISFREFVIKFDFEVNEHFAYESDNEEVLDFSDIKKELQSGQSTLLRNNVIQITRNAEFKTILVFELSPEYQSMIFQGAEHLINDLPTKSETDLFQTIHISEIKKTTLIYDTDVVSEINSLQDILDQDNFRKITERQAQLGLQPNVICLLHGSSGGGKSELVLQLGRETKRDLIKVNLSNLKSAYFGESQKQVQNLFDTYRKIYSQSTKDDRNPCPILWIDECESLFSDRRRYKGRTAIENILQEIVNILLTNLDNFNGILIMTSNYSDRIDGAFSRRINHKILIPKPSKDVVGKILHSVLSQWYTEAQCRELGIHYDLTGGMIKNIHQKVVNEYVIKGTVPSIDTIGVWCENECKSLGYMSSKNKIGFFVG